MAALNVVANLSVNLQVTEAITLGFAAAQPFQQGLQPAMQFPNGTAGGQIDQHWELKTVTLAASASVTYTLSALLDLVGRTIPLVKCRGLVFSVTSRTAGDYLTFGGAATHAWTAFSSGSWIVFDLFVVGVGQTDGYAVASGSNDQLKITNSGSNSITFSIGAFGTDV